MMIRTVELPKFVIKGIAWMLVDKKDVVSMPNASIQYMMPGVIACQASLEIQTGNAYHVSILKPFENTIFIVM